MRRVPLRNRSGDEVAHALVDDEDWEAVAPFRWSLTPKGYARRNQWSNGKCHSLFMHRVVLGLERDDELRADHINGQRLDNRRINLRAVSVGDNGKNRSEHGYGRSERRNVYWHSARGKWFVRVRCDGISHYAGGLFSDLDEADRAAADLRLTLFGSLQRRSAPEGARQDGGSE